MIEIGPQLAHVIGDVGFWVFLIFVVYMIYRD